MKIIALEAENVKNLRVVRIEPDGSTVIIGGDNEQGKTCVLDSIEYALHGASSIPAKPIRVGTKKARVVLDLGDIIVTRTFTKGGTNLTVKSKEGATFASPQAMLDKLVGALAFDPLEFSKMDEKKRAEVLKQLVGLDFDKLNAQYRKLFDERTVVNRSGKVLKASFDNMIKHDGVPDNVVSVQELGAKYAAALEHNQVLNRRRGDLSREVTELHQLGRDIAALKKSVKQKQKALEGEGEVDAVAINAQISSVESINNKIRENGRRKATNKELTELRKKSELLGNQMSEIVQQKEKTLAKAKFPIDGLAIEEEDGVTFEDIPFVQCSAAQRIRISVAIGLAMNPKLRVLLIREGSLLDEKNLAMIAEMAEKADAQIWIERVSKGKECSVIIEQGEVLEPETSDV